jgi:anti-sigma regulatory factor (Ser/Thr protein kinase)
MEWQFQADDARTALSVRREFLTFLRESCTSASDCEAALLVFGELVTNVILHAPGPIEITVQSDARGAVTLDVCDGGAGFRLAPSLPPVSGESGGRGLYIASRLCSSLASTRIEGGNKVSAVLPVTANQSQLHLVRNKLDGATPFDERDRNAR